MIGKIAYDAKLRRPACINIQAAFGGNSRFVFKFPVETWLSEITNDMHLHPVETMEHLNQLVDITVKHHETKNIKI
jgi:hypothetical protein